MLTGLTAVGLYPILVAAVFIFLAIKAAIYGLVSASLAGGTYTDFFDAFLCGFAFGIVLVPIAEALNIVFKLGIGLINSIWAARITLFDVVYGTVTMKQNSPLSCGLPF